MMTKTKAQLESILNCKLFYGWVTDGPGEARYGWYCHLLTGGQRWMGKTLAVVAEKVGGT